MATGFLYLNQTLSDAIIAPLFTNTPSEFNYPGAYNYFTSILNLGKPVVISGRGIMRDTTGFASEFAVIVSSTDGDINQVSIGITYGGITVTALSSNENPDFITIVLGSS